MTAGEMLAKPQKEPPKVAFMNDPKVRGLFWQAVLLLFVGFLVYTAVTNAYINLERQKIASGWGFLTNTTGFALVQSLIPYSEMSTYGRAFIVGLLNTLLIAGLGVLFATILGFFLGIARLSKNWLVAQVARWYVEFIRNIPLVLQLFFWYIAVLQPLPGPRQSLGLPDGLFGMGVYLNNRGAVVPEPLFAPATKYVLLSLLFGLVASFFVRRWARLRQEETGKQFPASLSTVMLIVGLPALVYFLAGQPITFDMPVLQGFNFSGGVRIIPEFAALLVGLVMYTAAFIAEIVRAGIQAIHKGQTEAASALGISPSHTLKLVVIPQAMRVIIPPLTSQYLNLTKNSSLAVAIGYPDLFLVAGTINNQTGQAVEVIAMTMGVYLFISLATSSFMNWYNKRVALIER